MKLKTKDFSELRKPTTKIGKYRYRQRLNGGYAIYWQGKDGHLRMIPVPSIEVAKERHDREVQETGRTSKTTNTYISFLAVPFYGKISLIHGRRVVNVKAPETTSVDGRRFRGSMAREDIKDSIRECYPIDQIERFKRGEIKLTLSQYSQDPRYERLYRSAWRTHGGFDKLMDEVYPGLHEMLKLGFDREQLRDTLIQRRNSGLNIAPYSLTDSKVEEERKLGNQIKLLTEKSGFKGKQARARFISKLTGLSLAQIRSTQKIINKNAFMAEKLTEFILEWAFLTGMDLSDYVSQAQVYREYDMLKFSSNNRDFRADRRVGNQAIEVRAGCREVTKADIQSFINRYSPGKGRWQTGELVQGSLIAFYKHDKLCQHGFQALQQAGIKIMSYKQSREILRELIKIMKTQYSTELEDVRPRVNNLDYFLYLQKELSLDPSVISRPAIRDRRELSLDLLEGLIVKSKALRTK